MAPGDDVDKDHLEKDLWRELDIDEDRDVPVLKVTVIIITVAAITAFVRAHVCRQYRAVPANADGSLSPRRFADAELQFAPDFVLPGQHSPRGGLQSPPRRRTQDEGWSLDVFSNIASRLAL